jgi:D-alanyl-D-alanine carboxypeptidase/D-alanyl-D-alanine-endopeptidase (penicillin-binding protein 4)
MGNYFGATPTALMWNDNMIEVALRSGQAGSDVMLAKPWPKDSPFQLEIDIQAADNNKDDAWFFSAPGGNKIYGKGTIPAHRESFIVKISNPDPMLTFCQNIIEAFPGGQTDVRIVFTPADLPNVQPLITFSSPSIADLMRVTNHESVNLFAEALNISNDERSIGRSVEGGTAASMAWMRKHKINTSGTRILDGSGVSPMNRVTAQAMVDALSAIYRMDAYEFFKASLPVAGESGTMKYYFNTGASKGNLRAKSGTMTGVRNYTGYVRNKYEENIAFCIMMNDYDEARKSEIMEKVGRLMEAVIQD